MIDDDKQKYLKIFKLELQNLIDDITELINYEKNLYDNNTHTNFVYLENLVVLKDEIMGINGILGIIDDLFIGFHSENYRDDLQKSLKEFVEKKGYPQAVYRLIERKIKKIENIKDII